MQIIGNQKLQVKTVIKGKLEKGTFTLPPEASWRTDNDTKTMCIVFSQNIKLCVKVDK